MKKIRLEPLSFFDHTGISAHLKKMAAKGWMIERIANYGWIYRKIEPKQILFAVSYFPKASEFDPEPSEAQQTFLDFCAHSGWTLACTSAQMQIFYNERENPVPIETDPMLELETIHNACYKSFFLVQFALLVIGLLMGSYFVGTVVTNPIHALSNPENQLGGLCWLLVVLLCVTDLITYFSWRKKALQAAEHGIFLDTFSTAKVQKAVLWILLFVGIYYLINVFAAGDDLKKFIAVAMLVYLVLLYVGVDGIKRLMKRVQASASTNKVVTFLAAFLLAFSMQWAIMDISADLRQAGVLDNGQKLDSRNAVPLRIEDLMEVPYDEYIITESREESIFLSRTAITQQADFETEHPEEMPRLSYTVLDTNMPWVYDWCAESLLKDKNSERVTHSVYRPLKTLENGMVYRLYFEDDPYNTYLFCFDNRIVQIFPGWELTGEQMTVIEEAFG